VLKHCPFFLPENVVEHFTDSEVENGLAEAEVIAS
jgi:hypothetical protein